jgi:hypothetical protein
MSPDIHTSANPPALQFSGGFATIAQLNGSDACAVK